MKAVVNKDPNEDEWRVRDARNTLQRAEEIKADKSLLRKIDTANKREAKAISSVLNSNKSKRGPKA